MRTEMTLFGLTFPIDFPLNDKSCTQLAEILLLNPKISVQKTKEIINDRMLWDKISLLITHLSCELQNVSFIDPETTVSKFSSIRVELLHEIFQLGYPKEDFEFAIFKKKLLSWIIEFTFPLHHELKIIASSLKISEEEIFDLIFKMLFLKIMPLNKISEYLIKYKNQLTSAQLDELLDLYSYRWKSTGVQLTLFDNQIHQTL